jgi:hypothetical protein
MEVAIYRTFHVGVAGLNFTGPAHGILASRPMEIHRIGLIVSVAMTGLPTVKTYVRPLPGSATGQYVLMEYAITPETQAAQTISFEDIVDPVARKIDPGWEVVTYLEGVAGGVGSEGVFFMDAQLRGFHKRNKLSRYYSKILDTAPQNG